MFNYQRERQKIRKDWKSLPAHLQDQFRTELLAIIRTQGPIRASEIKQRFFRRPSLQPFVTEQVRNLIGKNLVAKNDRGMFYAMDTEWSNDPVAVPNEGAPLQWVDGKPCTEPTHHKKGSEGRVQVYSARYWSGKSIWNDFDNPESVALAAPAWEAEPDDEDAELL